MFATAFLVLAGAFAPAVLAHPHAHAHAGAAHSHVSERALEGRWYHADSHPAHDLFRRDTDAATPTVGSAAWVANYPSSTPLANAVPQAWSAALNSAVQAGKIPNIPKTTVDPAAGPVYPAGTNGMDPTICSSTAKCRIDGDIWDAPTGVWGVGFDDGPIQGNSTKLYNFLQSKNQRATHFMIGVNILYDTEDFDFAFNTLKDDIAVHTWTHPYMTSLSNEDVVAQLGYTMQIIRDLTGGRLPRYWRPPYGDSDHRVRAIALEVFGLTTIIWNQDTEDWSITSGATTVDAVNKDLQGWFAGPKTPGLIILEHELSDESVTCFINNYDAAINAGWKAVAVTQMSALSAYQNAADDASAVTSAGIALAALPSDAPAGSASAAPSGASASAPAPASASGSASATAAAPSAPATKPAGASASVPAGGYKSAIGVSTPAAAQGAGSSTSPAPAAPSPSNGAGALRPAAVALLALPAFLLLV